MVKANCEECAPYNHGHTVHAQNCPHMTPFGMLGKVRAVETLLSSPKDIDMKVSAVQNKRTFYDSLHVDPRYLDLQNDEGDDFNVDPCHLYAFRNSVNRREAAGSADPSVELYLEGKSGCIRMTQSGMLEEARRHGRPLSSPETPGMETLECRLATYTRETSMVHPSQSVQCAENGFYQADNNNVKCFHCGISFRKETFEDPTWDVRREHARWSPFCGYLQLTNDKGAGIHLDVHISDEVYLEQGNGLPQELVKGKGRT